MSKGGEAAQKAVLYEYAKRMELINSRWTPHAGQRAVLQAIFGPNGKDRIFIQAGRKWGKTDFAKYLTTRVAASKNGAAVYIIGPNRKQQTEIMWANNRLQGFVPELGGVPFESQARLRFPWGSFIKIDGSENYDDHRGTEGDLILFDEFKDCDFRFYEAIYPNLLSRGGKLVVIGTPPDRRNHYTRLAEEAQADPDWAFFHGTSWENDRLPGGEEWLTKEKAKYYARGDAAIWEREYEAKFIPGGASAVFPMFDRNRHTRDYSVLEAELRRDMRKLEWYVVCDPGTTTVFGALFIAYNPYTSQVYILDEIYEKDRFETSTVKIWNRVIQKRRELAPTIPASKWNLVYDEAAAWFNSEVVAHFGEALVPTTKKTAKKESQMSLIKDLMARTEGFVIANHCENTIFEYENYVTDKNGDYIDKDDHTIDITRYFLDHCGYTFDTEVDYYNDEDSLRVYTPERDLREEMSKRVPLAFTMEDIEDGWIM